MLKNPKPCFCRPLLHKYPAVRCDIAHFFRRFLPGARPGVAAQFMQRRTFFRAAGMAANPRCNEETGTYSLASLA